MLQHQTFLRCSQQTAVFLFIFIGALFILAGCAQLYKTIGMTEDQVLHQVAQDQIVKEQILQGLRWTTTEILTTAIAGVGAIATGFLAKWLGTERKLTRATITGIEDNQSSEVKASVQRNAIAAGVEKKLNVRVKALT